MKPYIGARKAGANRRDFIRDTVAMVVAASTMKKPVARSLPTDPGSGEPETGALRCAGITRPLVLDLAGAWHFKEDPGDIGDQREWHKPGMIRGRIGEV